MDDEKLIKTYFHKAAYKFDAIYSKKKNFLSRFLDKHFRPDIEERFSLTFKYCGKIEGKKILDIGCGSGRYILEFLLRKAKKVTGIDTAENMLFLANKFLEENKINNSYYLINTDFLTYNFKEMFDISIAMGVFDYIKEPQALLVKIKNITSEKIIASFPSKSIIRTPIRKLRYKLKKCPVYFYNRKDIENIFYKTGFRNYKIIKIKGSGMDYVVVADCYSNKD